MFLHPAILDVERETVKRAWHSLGFKQTHIFHETWIMEGRALRMVRLFKIVSTELQKYTPTIPFGEVVFGSELLNPGLPTVEFVGRFKGSSVGITGKGDKNHCGRQT